MSATTYDAPSSANLEQTGDANYSRMAPGAGLVALILVILSLVLMFVPGYSTMMAGGYLFGFIFWICVALGCFGFTLLHHAVRGSWSLPLLRLFEAGGGSFVLGTMLVAFLPILANVAFAHHGLYEWTHHDVVAADVVLRSKEWYLNQPGFIGRTLVFFAIWIALAHGLRQSTIRQDESKDLREEGRRGVYGAVGLVMFFITVTFAMIDWGMSLTPHWYSTIYGLWFIVGQGLTALALLTLFLYQRAQQRPYSEVLGPKVLNDIGNMMFVLTMLWAYTSVSQLIIIWNGNIPETGQFYARRSDLGWNALGMAIIVGQFLVPWFALVAPRTKKTIGRLAKIAGWILFMRIVDVFWIIGPALPKRPWEFAVPSGFEVLGFLAMGAVWFWAFSTQADKAPLVPKYDPRVEELKHAH